MLAIKARRAPLEKNHKLPGLYATCLLGGTTFGCFSDKFRPFWLHQNQNECKPLTPPLHTVGEVQTHKGGGSMLSCAWRPPLARRVEA